MSAADTKYPPPSVAIGGAMGHVSAAGESNPPAGASASASTGAGASAPAPKAKKAKAPKAPKVEEEVPTCPICISPFTSTQRRPIHCSSCGGDTCAKCVEAYLLNIVDDPHCPHCKAQWNRAFLSTACTKTYMQNAYLKKRQTLLFERERSFFPQYQTVAERELRAREFEKERDALEDKVWRLRTEVGKQVTEIREAMDREFERIRKTMYKEVHAEEARVERLNRRIDRIRAGEDEKGEEGEVDEGAGAGASKPKREVAKFVRRCTVEGCNGFLSSVWKCGLCSNWVCPDCFEVKGPEKDAEHTCKPEMLETAKLIKKDTKPCPECGEVIQKTSGCFAENTPILGWNGQVIMSQDIRVGDLLIGDDGTPREVTATVTGEDELYEVSCTRGAGNRLALNSDGVECNEVKQSSGMSYIVNSKHTLVLKASAEAEPLEIRVDEFLELPKHLQANLYGFETKRGELRSIKVTPIGRGTYYGWSVTGNKRFVLQDFTCLRNCDQMWCISCHTPFSWETGKKVTSGVIHNPHYFQWMAQGGRGVPQNPGHIPCGGLPAPGYLERCIAKASRTHRNALLTILGNCMHTQEIERNRYSAHIHPPDNEALGVRFLMKDFTEEEYKAALARKETERLKSAEIRAALDAFLGASIDLFRRIDTERVYGKEEGEALIDEVVKELNALRLFIGDALLGIGRSFNCSVPYIQEDWRTDHGKPSDLLRRQRELALDIQRHRKELAEATEKRKAAREEFQRLAALHQDTIRARLNLEAAVMALEADARAKRKAGEAVAEESKASLKKQKVELQEAKALTTTLEEAEWTARRLFDAADLQYRRLSERY